MFNGLPPELVRQIFESSVPSTYQSKNYHDRQAILRSLCLVCHLFKDIARPLLFEFVRITRPRELDALRRTLGSKKSGCMIRQVIVKYGIKDYDPWSLTRLLQSCEGLRSLTLVWYSMKPLGLSPLQNLPHLTDLCLFGLDYQSPSNFRLHTLTSLSFNYQVIEAVATLLTPAVLPSLRSLALFEIFGVGLVEYLNQSRLADLVPQLEALFLHTRIIQERLDYLLPALSRTLFDFHPPPSNERIDLLQVAQHLRIPYCFSPEEFYPELAVSIGNQDRQTSLRTIYLDIGLEDLSSVSVDVGRVMQDLVRACGEKGIEVVYEEQDTVYGYCLTASAEFGRRQREIRNSVAAD